jgi:predicted transposase/invertase (TIGR01784 family)
LWPYAALTQTDDRAAVLRVVAQKIEALEDRREQSNLAAITAVMGGLSLEKGVIQRILRRDLMQESVIYQEWQAESKQQGKAEGKAEERRAIALNMLKDNLSLEQTSRFTGLTIAQLQQLQADSK